jgi:hypothetical protein
LRWYHDTAMAADQVFVRFIDFLTADYSSIFPSPRLDSPPSSYGLYEHRGPQGRKDESRHVQLPFIDPKVVGGDDRTRKWREPKERFDPHLLIGDKSAGERGNKGMALSSGVRLEMRMHVCEYLVAPSRHENRSICFLRQCSLTMVVHPIFPVRSSYQNDDNAIYLGCEFSFIPTLQVRTIQIGV